MSPPALPATPLAPTADRGGPRQPLLIVRGLRKHFPVRGGPAGRRGVVHAVDGVDLDVHKGEILGVVGESGCGKSTTARLVVRLIEPDAGEVIVDGESVGARDGLDLRALRRTVQLVFQDSFASLNPRLTVGETVAFGPRVHGLAAAEARARTHDLLARVGLEPARFAGRLPHELSGGQRQRVNLARALSFGPRLVILDEAVSALDKSVQAQVLNLLLELREALGLTYVFVSHDLHVVQYLSDRVLVMYLGQVVEVGPVARVYAAPAHPYTRALLAAMPSVEPGARRAPPPLAGDPPSPIDPPPGCRFRERCPLRHPVCEARAPRRVEIAPGHEVACLAFEPGSGHPGACP